MRIIKYQKKIITFIALLTLSVNCEAQKVPNKEKVIVVGAGLAGLTFTYRLQQKGYDVDLYEARSRVGGRVHTVYIKNLDGSYSLVELGGQNIDDGGKATNIFSLIKEFNLNVLSVNVPIKRVFYDGISFYDLEKLTLAHFPFTKQEIKNKLKKYQSAVSIKDVINKIFPDGIISPEQEILKRIFSSSIASYEGSTTDKLASYHNIDVLGEIMYTPKEQNENYWVLKHIEGGNSSLTTKIAENLGNIVHLNKTLKKVKTGKNKKIILTFEDGEEVNCDKLVLAIPAPVYKDIEFAEDTINATRLKSIGMVQYGTNTKVVVPIKFKDLTVDSIHTDNLAESQKSLVTWLNEDEKLLTLYFAGYGNNKDIQYQLYEKALSMIKLYYKNNVDFNTNHPIIPKEANFAKHEEPVIKLWVLDQYSKGSYSNYGVALGKLYDKKSIYKNTKVKTIFTPIDDRIFFIGEHATIIPEVGTMEAAVESAERTASFFKSIPKK